MYLVMVPGGERPQELMMLEEDASKDNHPLTDEEWYDLALENTALAFTEFLYAAMLTSQVHTCGAAMAIHHISCHLNEQCRPSDHDGANSSDEEHYI